MIRLAPDLSLPINAVTQAIAILGLRGSGKTHTAAVLAEGLDEAGQQIVVLDPTGAWWGLRASADGRGPGRQIVILGGDHGDAPLEAASGPLVADLVVDERVSIILDCSDFTLSDQRRFVADFAERLWTKTARNRRPRHLLIDECDEFVPQRVQADQARMVGAIGRLVKRGRIRGLGVTLISQRPASVNKDVLSQVETLVALRMTGAHDVRAVEDWIEHNVRDRAQRDSVIGSLATLDTGEAWVWSPSWLRVLQRVKFRRRSTFDSSATPSAGQQVEQPKRLAEVDLAAVQRAMAATVERAKHSDPAALRRRIADLERALAARPEADVRIVEVPTLTAADWGRLEDAGKRCLDAAREARAAAEAATGAFVAVGQKLPGGADAPQARRTPPGPAMAMTLREAGHPARAGMPRTDRAGLSRYARHLLETLARRRPMRPTRGQIALLSGRSPRSSAFHAAMGELLADGLIIGAGGQYSLTADGAREAGTPSPAGDLTSIWREALPAYERSLLDVLLAHGPLTREALGERAGRSTSSSAFHSAISTLAKNGLVSAGGGRVAVTELLAGAR